MDRIRKGWAKRCDDEKCGTEYYEERSCIYEEKIHCEDYRCRCCEECVTECQEAI